MVIELIEVTLITGRSLRQGSGKELGKLSDRYRDAVCICEMNAEDLEKLGIKAGVNVRVSTNVGSVVLKSALATQPLAQGTVFIPYGPYVNLLIDVKTDGTGMPHFKGVRAKVEPAPEEGVPDIKQLLITHFKKR